MLVTLDIPDSVLSALESNSQNLSEEFRLDLAVALYARGALPIGKAMELARLGRRDFEQLLKERQVRRPFDETELKRELG
jgi:predicted HTH domain antitoxin